LRNSLWSSIDCNKKADRESHTGPRKYRDSTSGCETQKFMADVVELKVTYYHVMAVIEL
jgi:hypothetical protein